MPPLALDDTRRRRAPTTRNGDRNLPGDPPARRSALRWTIAVAAILVLAAAGYGWLIPVRRADTARLATLAPTDPPAGFTHKPAGQGPVAASKVGLTELVDASRSHPDASGAYSVEWVHHSATTGVAEVIVLEAPTVSDGATLREEAVRKFTDKKGMEAAGETRGASFSVPSLPGVSGTTFTTTGEASSTTATTVGHGATVVVGHGSAVAVALVDEKGSSAEASVGELARRALSRLDAERTPVPLAKTSIPLVATIVYAGAVVVVLSTPGVGVVALRRVRRRRTLAQVRAAEQQRLARGRRTVKRQAGRAGSRRT